MVTTAVGVGCFILGALFFRNNTSLGNQIIAKAKVLISIIKAKFAKK